MSPTDNSTKESIDNSLDQASMSSYIENNSIFVGSVSILVSTAENYFPLNYVFSENCFYRNIGIWCFTKLVKFHSNEAVSF